MIWVVRNAARFFLGISSSSLSLSSVRVDEREGGDVLVSGNVVKAMK